MLNRVNRRVNAINPATPVLSQFCHNACVWWMDRRMDIIMTSNFPRQRYHSCLRSKN